MDPRSAIGGKPKDGCEAHHVVPINAQKAAPALKILLRCGIDVLKGCTNGILLKAGVHHGIHTTPYYDRINDAIQDAYDSAANKTQAEKKRAVENALKKLRGDLDRENNGRARNRTCKTLCI